LVALVDVELVDLDLGIAFRAGGHGLSSAQFARRSVWQLGT
jgi:hypothetical protein